MSVNWDAVHKLLSISDLAHQWPRLKALTDAAQRELEVHAEGAAKENADAVAKKVEEDAKVEAAAVAKANAEANKAKAEADRPSPTPFFRRTEEA